jgi:tyrosyl-tRNA synthetase
MNTKLSIEEVLTRGVEQVLPSQDGLAKLMAGQKIRLYLGIDPTGNQLHLGHAVVLRKMQQFVDLGHEVILLIGNGTVKIGDPSGRDKTRPMLTDEVIEENFQTWKDQASQVLDFSRVEVKRNADWMDDLDFTDMVKLMSKFTLQQLLERDMFQDRMKNNRPIFMHELIYPIMQGFDSVVMDVDLELGGNDQLFNMMVGRQLMKESRGKDKFVLAMRLLVGSDGRKMGKSLGNFISLTATPENMFGQIMASVDSVIPEYFRLLTDVPETEIESMEQAMAAGENPLAFKKRLAFVITSWLHGEPAAEAAREHFERTVQQKELPAEMPELAVPAGEMTLLDLVFLSGAVASRSKARRLIEQGGVELAGERLIDPQASVNPNSGDILRVGKRQYFRLR